LLFLALSATFNILFGHLISTVSIYSRANCGITCGQNEHSWRQSKPVVKCFGDVYELYYVSKIKFQRYIDFYTQIIYNMSVKVKKVI